METNWMVIAPILVFVPALIVFLILRNLKDKDDFISALNAQDHLNERQKRIEDTELF